MSEYIKTKWVDDKVPALCAENLNHMEDGIEAAAQAVSDVEKELENKADADKVYEKAEADRKALSIAETAIENITYRDPEEYSEDECGGWIVYYDEAANWVVPLINVEEWFEDYSPGGGGKGDKGDKGDPGADGFSPTATVTKENGVATVTITDKNGTTTATISDGAKGDAYTLTAADKTEIATEAAGMVDVPTNVSAFTNDAGYLTEHQDISGKADASNVYSKAQTDAKLNNKVNNSDFIQYKSTVYTAAEIDSKNFLTTHQSLAAYAKKTELPTKTSELENDSGFLTSHQTITPSTVPMVVTYADGTAETLNIVTGLAVN